ncbi:hypothetical protein VT930_21075 [Mycobacterium sherrisii]|nr:hypothetical protein [Mycobacterium sherrisii]MEC4765564.1 hypothetical protein [Mycobacterium sherrisii]
MAPDMDKSPELIELIDHYEKWRRIYSYAGEAPPDEPDWEDNRLYFRIGYPYPDWSALVLEMAPDGLYRVLQVSTERRNEPVESLRGVFSRIEDAGKFIIYKVATSLMIGCNMDPLSWRWDDEGINPEVDIHIQSDAITKYVLREKPEAYFIMTRGDMPYSHLLPLSYDRLDAELLASFPDSVTSRVNP